MTALIGIRREDKNQWEARTPLTPKHVKRLKQDFDISVVVQPSPIRAFSEEEYTDAGASINEDLSNCPVVFAVKEIPSNFFLEKKTYVFFSHTIKGQDYNMPMLKTMMEKKCTLIDYERIVDRDNRRLVFFGRFAGLAGMIDTLWSLGQRLERLGVSSPFCEIKKTLEYDGLSDAMSHLKVIGEKIINEGIPAELGPLVIGIAGYGNVSKGAQEILEPFDPIELSPDQLLEEYDSLDCSKIYKVIFKEIHLAKRKDGESFELQQYYSHPELYEANFSKYAPYLTVLVNSIYWDERYPRLLTKGFVRSHVGSDEWKLLVIGDISIDIDGAIEFTGKATKSDCPSFVYDPVKDAMIDGFKGNGIVVMAVDNLPCELPKDASDVFSDSLYPFVEAIAKANYDVEGFENLDLPFEVKKAVILFDGKLTPEYQYIDSYL